MGRSSGPYEQALDIFFPMPSAPSDGNLFMAALRFGSVEESESQIDIVQHNDGRFTVTHYFVPAGLKSVDHQFTILFPQEHFRGNYWTYKLSSQDVAKIEKEIKIGVQTVDVPLNVMSDLTHRLDNIHFPTMRIDPRAEGMATIVVHGYHYKLWYKTDFGEVFVKYSIDSLRGKEKAANELAEWMNRVKAAVESAN